MLKGSSLIMKIGKISEMYESIDFTDFGLFKFWVRIRQNCQIRQIVRIQLISDLF